MNRRRFGAIFGLELAANARRPLLWVLILLVGFLSLGLARGNVAISTGDDSVGGHKAWITSEFSNGHIYSLTIFLFYSFFLAVAAGMSVIKDDELRVSEILHATSLRPREYIWAKFSSVMAIFAAVLALNVVFSIFFNHVYPNPEADKIRGPFSVVNYLRPALAFGLPTLLFIGGVTFAVGERTRRPILVFVLPVAAIIVCGFFVWTWAPTWLDQRVNRVLMMLDPAGYRWLNETWLKVDRGVTFYNTRPMEFDAGFLLSRLAFVAIGLGAVVMAERHLGASIRGVTGAARSRAWAAETSPDDGRAALPDVPATPIASAMKRPGLLRVAREVARVETRELWSQPGMYIFVPLILIQIIGNSLTAIGAFGTPILVTPGLVAVSTMNTVMLLVCLLLLFYTTESLLRERHTGLASIYLATPGRTPALLLGKTVATALIGVVILAATLLGAFIAVLVQHKVKFDVRPFLLVWGIALLPTFFLWNSFVMMVLSIVRNRYTTYAIGLAALIITGYFQVRGKMNWVGNWDLWSALRWSDLGTFELDRAALILNRVMALGLAILFGAIAVYYYPRRDGDALRIGHHLRPGAIWSRVWRFGLVAILPLAAGIWLWTLVNNGYQGEATKRKQKDYWKQNLATWKDAPRPAIAAVDLDLSLDPPAHAFTMKGSYLLRSDEESPLRRFAVTTGSHWRDLQWTVDGAKAEPENRSGLYVFTPPAPLARGDTLRIGFAYHGVYPRGVSKNGGTTEEFILPSGIVLTSFRPSFVPVMGFMEEIGVDDKNRYEPRQYPDDFYEGMTTVAFGEGRPFTTRIRVSAPAAYTLNSVGTMESDEVVDGQRTSLWVSDQPVRFFNVVGGRWKVRRGEGTAIFYDASHGYNIEEMGEALDAARRWYSEWFMPFPWRELKLSEFPGLAFYAQGFPTDITFSEGIGFLTRSSPKSQAAFIVTAHESAHQWWGNILTPGKGPGGNLLSEGMSHFSTLLLLEQVKGARDRIEFAKRIEERYGDNRRADAERKLVLIDESKEGDQTVVYDKGGWVFWMLLDLMGRDAGLAGYRDFISRWGQSPDHPVLQDLTAGMRRFAPDTLAYDDFVHQWFYDVVVPQYRVTSAAKNALPDGSGWEAVARIDNIGTGKMPVEVAATRGKRWDEKGGFEEARTTVLLGAGEGQEVRIRSRFEPEMLVVDPDARVLQLERKSALARF